MCGGVNHSWFRRHCEPTGRANARPMTGSAKQSGASRLALDCFVALLLAMTSIRILAARFASEFCTNFVPRKQRAQGRPGAGRTRSLVCSKKAHELVTTGSTETSGLPCAMVLTLLRALPGVRDLIVTVACETSSRKLSASPGAPGPHDLASRAFPELFQRQIVAQIFRAGLGLSSTLFSELPGNSRRSDRPHTRACLLPNDQS
jgi:hypothetical protein